jgi:regulator of sigma E protease
MILTIIVFLVMLSILVFVHEFGHFLVAKKLGMGVEEFGFGLPPRIWGKKIGATIYSLNWLPIGGFVRLTGEDQIDAPKIHDKKTLHRFFWARSKRDRAAVLLAGVSMNFILAVVIISYIFTKGAFVPINKVQIDKVTENSPAASAGVLDKDIVVSFAGKPIKNTKEIIQSAQEFGGQETDLVLLRNNQEVRLKITPRKNPPAGEGAMGIVITDMYLEKKYVWYKAPFYGLLEAFNLSYMMLSSLGEMVFKLITFQPSKVDVAGPVGIAQATGKAIGYGYMAVLQLMGLLSLNLAIFNLLPIPALDGGRLFFVLFEKWLGKHVKPRAEQAMHQVGMAFLLGLIVLITINDIVRLIQGKTSF